MKNKGLIATIIIMSGVIVMLLVTLLLIKMPSIVGVKSIVEIEPTEESKIETVEPTTVVIPDETKIKTNIMHYNGYNDHVDIEYPEISGMDDTDLQARINYKIKMNALSIVPLYPISTALQKLDIYCDVKRLDDKYITIIYSGRVVGNKVTNPSSGIKNTQSSTANKNNSTGKITGVKGKDPYLDGFVDPLATTNIGMNTLPQNNQSTTITNGATMNSVNLPTPNSAGVEVFKNQTQATSKKETQANRHSSTADAGPTVTEISAPTKEKATPTSKQQTYYEGNVATNNPTSNIINNNNTSSGIVYSGGSATNVNPNVGSSNAPDSEYGPGNKNQINAGAPVYAYAGSNNSASTIDQNIYYTNTIDLVHCIDVPLASFADPEMLAKYARSSKAEFVNIDSNKISEVRTYVRKTPQVTLTEQLKEADFRNIELKIWPKNFSYQDVDGSIYFTIRLSSKLGNYVIIKYNE